MKLSELKGEAAITALAEVMDPATEIMADEKVQKVLNKPKLLIAKVILQNHAKAILTILAVLDQKDPETYKPSIIELTKGLLELLDDEEMMDLFHSQGLKKEGESSVSASENIAE